MNRIPYWLGVLLMAWTAAAPVRALADAGVLLEGYSTDGSIAYRGRGDAAGAGLRLEIGNHIFTVQVQSEGRLLAVRGRDRDTGATVRLAPAEADAIDALANRLLAERPTLAATPGGRYLLRALNLLADWPPGLAVELLSTRTTRLGADQAPMRPGPGPALTSACDWPPPLGLSESLCARLGEQHPGDYIRLGLKVGELPFPPYSPVFYPLACRDFSAVVGGSDPVSGCFGRCGRGCAGDGPPNNPLDIYTQNCFNHDGCVTARGLLDDYCNQMFVYAAPDFLFGTDCKARP